MLNQVRNLLAEFVCDTADSVQVLQQQAFVPSDGGTEVEVDGVLQLYNLPVYVKFKRSAALPVLELGVQQVVRLRALWPDRPCLALLVTPYMSEAGRDLCKQARVSWIDLSGNCRIQEHGVYAYVQGQPNKFKAPGRPSSAFAAKSSRIARWLLSHATEAFSQRDLARETAMGEGFTSRIVGRLLELQLLKRDVAGRVKVSNPELLLKTWAEDYRFDRHELHMFHVAARSGPELTSKVAHSLRQFRIEAAATGLAAAWMYQRFANFRTATFYVRDRSALETWEEQEGSLRQQDRGGNLWIALPNDLGVFQGTRLVDEVPCVEPVQAWLDLAQHPERAREAADHLQLVFPWTADAS